MIFFPNLQKHGLSQTWGFFSCGQYQRQLLFGSCLRFSSGNFWPNAACWFWPLAGRLDFRSTKIFWATCQSDDILNFPAGTILNFPAVLFGFLVSAKKIPKSGKWDVNCKRREWKSSWTVKINVTTKCKQKKRLWICGNV